MKYTFIILLAFFLFGCSIEGEKGQFEPVVVSTTEIPSTAKIGEVVPVYVKAYAPNGCWSKLQINLTKSDENHYLITATGYNNGDLACPDIVIQTDTVFNLSFNKAGAYYFQSNKLPFTLLHDTIRIQE